MTILCAVCSSPAREDALHYANAWERSRKRYPCCSESCARAFNLDIHWLPSLRPEPPSNDEGLRLLDIASKRLTAGDSPTMVTRDLLLAGLDVARIKKVLGRASMEANRAHDDARFLSLFGLLTGLFTGQGFVAISREKRRAQAIGTALDAIDAWQRRWPDSNS